VAEDVVHDVFAELARRGTSRVANVEAHLRQAVRHRSFSAIRARTRLDGTDARLIEPVESGLPADERLALEQALRNLPPEQREVVHLKLYEGWRFRTSPS
jgi:DNA-directed RNA polymerase specialized sigma24 family protein